MDAIGNSCGDVMADHGAQRGELLPYEFGPYLEVVASLRLVQRRLVTILRQHVIDFPRESSPKVPVVPPPQGPLSLAMMCSQHAAVLTGTSISCGACWRGVHTSSRAEVFRFLLSPCGGRARPSPCPRIPLRPGAVPFFLGRPVHATHDLVLLRGLLFCRRCGHYAAKRLLRLHGECPPAGAPLSHHGQLSLRALMAGQLPRDLAMWPDDAHAQSHSSPGLCIVLGSPDGSPVALPRVAAAWSARRAARLAASSGVPVAHDALVI